MTWPAGICIALGLIAAAMIWASHHGIGTRNTTTPQDQPDGDPST